MKFLIDAQLPRQLARYLQAEGHDTRHTLDLPQGNETTDEALCKIAQDEERVLVSKDADFVSSFLLRRLPPRLLLISTGNLSNQELLTLFKNNLVLLTQTLSRHSFVEMDQSGMTVHD